VCYQQKDIDAAVQQGHSLQEQDKQIGRSSPLAMPIKMPCVLIHNTGKNKYPHSLDNREGFPWFTNPPYYEFPIMSSRKVYTGGSPGADRVIFDDEGNFARALTHTGASGNAFVECK
jgi:hypothetical protein